MSVYRSQKLPRPALVLTVLGILPVIACSVQVATGRPLEAKFVGPALYVLFLYSAMALTFCAGAQWGLAVGSADRSDAWRRFGVSVVPALASWAAVWISGRYGLVLLSSGHILWAIYDAWTSGLGEAPAWYGQLRFAAGLIVAASIGAAAYYGPF